MSGQAAPIDPVNTNPETPCTCDNCPEGCTCDDLSPGWIYDVHRLPVEGRNHSPVYDVAEDVTRQALPGRLGDGVLIHERFLASLR